MTKKQLTEKWQIERSKAAGEASKLNLKLAGLAQKMIRCGKDREQKRLVYNDQLETKSKLFQLAARVVTIDEFLKDI